MQDRDKVMMSIALMLIGIFFLLNAWQPAAAEGKKDNSPDWFYPSWAAEAKYNKPIFVRDTDSALGRYSLRTKQIGLKDLTLFHGHMCDGLVIAFVEIKGVLEKLFPDGVVDRTDIQAVSKNGPCWVDAVMMMTGARVNFRTLRIDNSIGAGFIIQRISTGEAYEVHLKPGVFPEDQAALESKIRKLRSEDKTLSAADIDRVEKMADALNKKLLTTAPNQLLTVTMKPEYRFGFSDLYGRRGDVINKDMRREKK
jgi:formylmethanofuran dehydrogenase subunit E